MPSPYASLQRTEALARRALLDITSYDVSLDLASDDSTFESVTTIRLRSRAGRTFLDLKPVGLAQVRLDGRPLDVDLLERGRLPLELADGEHELVVEATMPFRNDGEGLHRSVDPADGRRYVYGMTLHGRGADDLRLLRPARPQGAVHRSTCALRRTGS